MNENVNHHPVNVPNSFPQTCPVCLHDIELKPLYLEHGKNGNIWIFKCPLRQCQAVFSMIVKQDENGAPKIIESPNRPGSNLNNEELRKISPKFVKTYQQASAAEAHGYDEIFGEAYRKATEWLVKDFLIKYGNTGKTQDQILKMHLGDAVDKLPDSRLVNLAKASAWLGNDQTHPLKKHPNYGVQDLKNFIEALAAFAIYSMRAKEAESFVNGDANKS